MTKFTRPPVLETLGWLIHDAAFHPLTGFALAVAKLCLPPAMALRVSALAHHVHNFSTPTNDSLADYAEAAGRAGSNERTRHAGDEANCWACGDPGWRGKMKRVDDYTEVYPEHRTRSGVVCPASGQRPNHKEQLEMQTRVEVAELVMVGVKAHLASPEFLDALAAAIAKRG